MTRKKVAVWLPVSEALSFKDECARRDVPMADVLRDAINEFMSEYGEADGRDED